MNRPLSTWLLFALFLALAAGGLGWLTRQTQELDRAEVLARGQAEQEERIGLALWRMDAFLMPLLVQEASRPEFVYQANFLTADAKGSKASAQRILSPLLENPPPFVKLHFQLAPDGRLTSPQAPQGEDLTWSLGNGASEGRVSAAQQRAEALRALLDYDQLVGRLPAAEPLADLENSAQTAGEPLAANNSIVESFAQQSLARQQDESAGPPLDNPPRSSPPEENQAAQAASPQPPQQQPSTGANEPPANFVNRRGQSQLRNPNADLSSRNNVYQAYAQRAAADNLKNFNNLLPLSPPAIEGVSSPLWVGSELLLARRVKRSGQTLIQGCWLDWEALSARLKQEVADVLPEVEFRPAHPADTRADSAVLATLPVQVIAAANAELPPASSPIRLALALAWVGLLVAAAAAAVTLHSVLALSERLAAYVAAVTHELRTPLTTFRMYAEMLAGGMVPAERQPTYLETLRAEADRLAHLVENVLQYARLERGRNHAPRETIAAGDLSQRVSTRLEARAQEAGLQLLVAAGVEKSQVKTDVGAFEQILFNLVDNACKYAAHGADKRLHLEVAAEPRRLVWRVRDHGPGIPSASRKRLFQPFTKSVHEAAATAPGVGLGLALSRRLAKELGGELRLESSDSEGTVFALRLPKD
jgi:signal transduction histidine kinase